jgi:HlyD family secretion protein
MKKLVRALLLITLILALSLAWSLWKQHKEEQRPPGSSGIAEGTRVVVASRIGSRIQKVFVQEGTRVQEGEELALLDCVEYDAQVLAAEARRDANKWQAKGRQALMGSMQLQETRAKKDEERALLLQKNKAIDDVTVETLATSAADFSQKVSEARASVSAAERQYWAAEAELKRALVMQSECVVKAPRSGIISVRTREAGEVVMPGAPLFEIVDDTFLRVKFYVTNKDLGRVKTGQSVSVVADAFPEKTFEGVITRVADTAEFTPKTIQTKSDRDRLVYAVEANLKNPDAALRSGMPVEVRVRLEKTEGSSK